MRRNDAGEAIVFRDERGATRRLAWRELARSRLTASAGDARGRGRRRRPCRGAAAEYPGSDRRDACRRVHRRGVVVGLAGFRCRGGARPLRSDRAEVVDRVRRLPLRRQGDQTRRQAAGDRRGVAKSRGDDRRALPRACGEARRRAAERPCARRGAGAVRRQSSDLRAACLRAPALHPVLVGHDGNTEVHRALGRRHAAPAPEGAPLHCGIMPGDRVFYFTTLRVDDVELAGLGARVGGDIAAL